MFKQIKKIMLYLWHQKTFTYSLQIFYKIQKNFSHTHTGVLVKFLMVRETNSVVGYHLLTEGHSIQLGSAGGGRGHCDPPPSHTHTHTHQVHSSILIIVLTLIIFSELPIKSQSNLSLKFLIKWFLNKKTTCISNLWYEILEHSWEISRKKNQPSK